MNKEPHTVTIEQLEALKDSMILCSNGNLDGWKRLSIDVGTDKNGKANASYHITSSTGFNKRCSFLKKAIMHYNSI